jgi:endonuclease G
VKPAVDGGRGPAEAIVFAPGAARADRPRLTVETLPMRVSNLSFAGARPSHTELERMIGRNDLVDEFYLERALIAAHPVCRLVLRDASGHEIGYATGFLVSPRLVLTNWHVFRVADEATNALAEFEYKLDVRGNPVPPHRFAVRPDLFYHSNQDLDYCLVAVDQGSVEGDVRLDRFGYHALSPDPSKIQEREWITIVQHPGGQRRQFAIRENQLIDTLDQFLWYRSDTAQGSSGAPAFNDSFQVVALHHSGKARRQGAKYVLKDGTLVDSIDGLDDSLIDWEANEGLRISQLCADMRASLPESDEHVSELYQSMQTGGIMARAMADEPVDHETQPVRVADGPSAGQGAGDGIVLPLRIQVSVEYAGRRVEPRPSAGERPVAPRVQPAALPAAVEKFVRPTVDPDYQNRQGYDPRFLGTEVPLPKVTRTDLVAKMDNGKHEIPYEHFSVVVHKTRRLSVFTASNVNGNPKSRRPEPGDYTRHGLGGLEENDREEWVTDPRIPENHQVPDTFYTKDGGAFDKGHIVRREDVCWGGTRDQIVRANGDTYHTTNCSPQVAEFNQSGKKGIWGKLENEVLKQVKGERFSLFAGPVLRDNDRTFEGKSKHGPLKVKIPARYWKVVLAMDAGKLEAFAFVLEQDLSGVPLERFEPGENWVAHMISVADLEKELRIVKFPDAVRNADQFGTTTGDEVLKATELERYTRPDESAGAPIAQ